MKIETAQELNEYRLKLNKLKKTENGTPVDLYGVFRKALYKPVTHFTKITKAYMYDENNKKYYNLAFDSVLFTSQSEAWKFLYKLIEKRKQSFQEYLKTETKLLEEAQNIINEELKTNPQFFL